MRALNKQVEGFSDEALACMQAYHWPGNVRELENVIERACIMREGTSITARDLPGALYGQQGSPSMPSTLVGGMISLEDLEKAHILQVLEAVGWHKKRAAEILEINPSTLYRKLLRYGVGQEGDEEYEHDDDRDPADLMVEALEAVEREGLAEPAIEADPEPVNVE
jgi:DNA-binding NtrC family response regulator